MPEAVAAASFRLRFVQRTMIVCIDGPAGAGKSTVARQLAQRLGFHYLDTGAMYRAATLGALRRGVDWNDPKQVAQVVQSLSIDWLGDRILLQGEDVTDQIRTPQITQLVHYVADNPEVRRWMVEQQRRVGRERNLVTEGRDQGTVVFPQAELKVFLTASPETRARRRQQQLAQQGIQASLEQILQEQQLRDQRDSSRSVGPLVPAPDAIELDTTGMTLEEVVDHLERLVREKMPPGQ